VVPSWCCKAPGWTVSVDENQFITMTPVGEHKQTLIYLHGLALSPFYVFEEMFIKRSGIVPSDFKIILP
jgi:hypothetical protein